MNKAQLIASIYLGVFGVLAFNGADAATPRSNVAPQDKIEACIAEVAEQADYSEAAKVRHIVESSLYVANKHKLRIETQLLRENDDTVIREFASICVAPNGDKPVTLKTRERL